MPNATFSVSKVSQITKTVKPTGGDTFVVWNGGTIEDLKELIHIGAVDPDDYQNNSPTIQNLIDTLAPISHCVTLTGYVVYPPRTDARVSIDGFNVKDVTADELLNVLVHSSFRNADELDIKQDGYKYSARFWWD